MWLCMKYEVILTRNVEKGLVKLPLWVHKTLAVLANDLRDPGPLQLTWPHDSTLSPPEYHGHGEPVMGRLLAA